MKFLIYILFPAVIISQINLCDSINVNLIDNNQDQFQINIQMNYTTEYWYGYCGLIIENNLGDTIALENINTAPNAYGLGPGMNEYRTLEVVVNNLDFPLEGQIHLVENFFAGNGYIVCSWPVYIEGQNNSQTIEKQSTKELIKSFDLLGRNTMQKGFLITIYDDGSVKKILK